jgi:hypothetical protein
MPEAHNERREPRERVGRTCRDVLSSLLLTSNRPVDDWGKLLGDTAAVTALLDRLLPSVDTQNRPLMDT